MAEHPTSGAAVARRGAILFCLVLIGSAVADAVVEVGPPGTAEPSRTYAVRAEGRPLHVQRCDGRAGPASYVHVIITGSASFKITCPSAAGRWDVSSSRPIEPRKDETTLSFIINEPAKLLIRTEADERLFILADSPEQAPPRTGEPGVISIADYGAGLNSGELLTGKIQKAIDELAGRPGGGTLVFPPGLYRTGTIRIRTHVTVWLAAGARLQGSEDPADYPLDPGTQEQPDRTQDIRSRLILFDGAQDAALVGLGEIDGAGQVIRGERYRVPNLIRVRRSRGIRIEGVLLRRAAGWNTHIFHSDDVVVRNVKSISNFSDGLDADNSRKVTIEDVLIDSYDDSFVVKATNFEGHAEQVRGISLRGAVLATVKSAVKIGTETNARVIEDISVRDVVIAEARGGLVIELRDGALVQNLLYENIRMEDVRKGVTWSIRQRRGLGRIEDAVLSRIEIHGTPGSHLSGFDEQHQISGVRIIDSRLDGRPILKAEDGKLEVDAFVSNLQITGPATNRAR